MITTFTTTVNLTDRCYKGRGGRVPTLIGIHTMEAPEAGSTAENVANYFKTVDASAHWCVDNNSRVRTVNDADGAWTMPPTNLYSLNVELAGYAGQSPLQWEDGYSIAALEIAAVCVAEWCRKYDIPVRHLTAGGIDAGEKGIAGHWDVNNVFHQSDHTDPGVNFPWQRFLYNVSKLVGTNFQPVPPTFGKPDCTRIQGAVHTAVDNQWGPDTDKHCTALIEASDFGGNQFPYGVAFLQEVVGAKQDGVAGPVTWMAHTATVRKVQDALRAMRFDPGTTDGLWGPLTDKAYHAARSACHI
jgi:N-acetylmuramoyl-L-alanine amidase